MGKKAKDGAKQRTSSSASATTVPAPTTDSASVTNSPTVIDSTVSSPDPVHSPRRTRALGSLLLVAILAILGVGILGLIRHNNAANVKPLKYVSLSEEATYKQLIANADSPKTMRIRYQQLADNYESRSEYDKILSLYLGAEKEYPKDAIIQALIGQTYFNFHDGRNATIHYTNAINYAKQSKDDTFKTAIVNWQKIVADIKNNDYTKSRNYVMVPQS